MINMDKNNLVNIINEDKPFLSLAGLAEKFEKQPLGAKVAEILLLDGLSLIPLASRTEGVVTPEPPPGPVEELYLGVLGLFPYLFLH